uniref:Uncharacterized protein n=1 Tax=Acrobeloides nanus TaxID=290746 RepID=A0A914D9C6_9BILA
MNVYKLVVFIYLSIMVYLIKAEEYEIIAYPQYPIRRAVRFYKRYDENSNLECITRCGNYWLCIWRSGIDCEKPENCECSFPKYPPLFG